MSKRRPPVSRAMPAPLKGIREIPRKDWTDEQTQQVEDEIMSRPACEWTKEDYSIMSRAIETHGRSNLKARRKPLLKKESRTKAEK